MKSERLQLWISRILGTPAGPVEEITEVVVVAPVVDSGPAVQPNHGQVMAKRTLAIIGAFVFAPIIVIVIVKVLRDLRSSFR